MLLQGISLQHFRSYSSFNLKFSTPVTLIVGPNAVGKTNIIESIFSLTSGGPFRGDKDVEVIEWGEEIARIKGKLEDDILELVFTPGMLGGQYSPKKKFLVNGVSRRMVDFVGHLPSVLFWPEDLMLVLGSPGIRRNYLNTVLSQVDRDYRRNLSTYEKGLRQRNKILFKIREGEANRSELVYWDSLLISNGNFLTKKREEYIEFVNSITHDIPSFNIVYDKSVISEARLAQYANEEISAKSTLVGPHRDDFEVLIQKDTWRNLSQYGSRGEERLGVLWLKLSETSYIEQSLHVRPLLLLDDIFSELDVENRKHVLNLIQDHQTVMTSAEEESVTIIKSLEDTPTILHLPMKEE